MGLRADQQVIIDDAVGSQRLFVKRILGDQFELPSRFDDHADAFLAQEINVAVRLNRRGGIVTADAPVPDFRPRLGVETGSNSGVRNHVQFVA